MIIRLAALVLASVPVAAQVPTYGACTGVEGETVAVVHVSGFKDRAGNLRVELYPATNEDFLAPGRLLREQGKTFQRIDIPTTPEGEAVVCLALPAEGLYAIAVLHDRNASGKLDPFSDGFGFPNNSPLGFSKPAVDKVSFTAGAGQTRIDVVLKYWNGLSARPVKRPR
jgi:uncharacterized protein (DUF2141 family)